MGHEVNSKVQPGPGEALRRLIEKWRKVEAAMDTERYDADNPFALDVQRRNYCDGKRIGFKSCADALEAALAPLSGPVDGLTCPKHGVFDARCETCPFCLQEQSLKRLAGPVDASGEPEQALVKVALSMRREAALWPKTERAQQTARLLNSFAADIEQIAALPPSSPVADSPKCPKHTDPLVCLACEAEEDARPEWQAAAPSATVYIPGSLQKALTIVMVADAGAQQADAALDAVKKGSQTIVVPASEMFFHQLRLRVAEDDTLAEKIAVFYADGGELKPVGLRFADELRWPVGFLQEQWTTEVAIDRIRQAARKASAPSPSAGAAKESK